MPLFIDNAELVQLLVRVSCDSRSSYLARVIRRDSADEYCICGN